MQVSKINASTSFKGLWEHKNEELGRHTEERCPVYHSRVIYRPFADETPEQIEKATKGAPRKTKIMEEWRNYGDPYGPEKILISDVSVGKKLDITEAEYNALQKMTHTYEPEGENQYLKYQESVRYDNESILDGIE